MERGSMLWRCPMPVCLSAQLTGRATERLPVKVRPPSVVASRLAAMCSLPSEIRLKLDTASDLGPPAGCCDCLTRSGTPGELAGWASALPIDIMALSAAWNIPAGIPPSSFERPDCCGSGDRGSTSSELSMSSHISRSSHCRCTSCTEALGRPSVWKILPAASSGTIGVLGEYLLEENSKSSPILSPRQKSSTWRHTLFLKCGRAWGAWSPRPRPARAPKAPLSARGSISTLKITHTPRSTKFGNCPLTAHQTAGR